jgi:hypothetical protein
MSVVRWAEVARRDPADRSVDDDDEVERQLVAYIGRTCPAARDSSRPCKLRG